MSEEGTFEVVTQGGDASSHTAEVDEEPEVKVEYKKLIVAVITRFRPTKGLSRVELKKLIADQYDVTVQGGKFRAALERCIAKKSVAMVGQRYALGKNHKKKLTKKPAKVSMKKAKQNAKRGKVTLKSIGKKLKGRRF